MFVLKPSRIAMWFVVALVLFGQLESAEHSTCLVLPRSAVLAAEKPSPAVEDEESWSVLYLGKSRIGYTRTATKNAARAGKAIVRTENDSAMVIKRFGQVLKTMTKLETEETPEGELLDFVFEMQNPPAGSALTRGKVQGDELLLEMTVAGKLTTKKIPWDRSLKSPAYQDRILRDPPLKPGEKREFKTFLPELAQVATVVVQAVKPVEVELLGGEKRSLMQIDMTQSVLPGIVSKVFVDRKGDGIKSTTNFLGSEMITYTVPQEEALKSIVGEELDVAVGTLVQVAPIANPDRTERVVYRATIRGEDPSKVIPSSPTQQLKRIDDETAELTVTAPLPPKPGENAASTRPDAEFLSPTRYLQSDDPRVVEHARAAAGGETDPWKTVLKMESYVYQHLKKKNFSTALASAAEVAKSMEGDCTEHACLLAAMTRSHKIPSRIAVGLVYAASLSSFGGHMWTEVFIDGRWIPVDATLKSGGRDAVHIKLQDSSFADEGPLPVANFIPLSNLLGKIELTVLDVKHRNN